MIRIILVRMYVLLPYPLYAVARLVPERADLVQASPCVIQRLFELKKKYSNIIRPRDTDSKRLKRIAEKMEAEEHGQENE